MTSIQIRLPFLLLLLHVSVFAAPISLRSSPYNVRPSSDLHAKRQSDTNPVRPLNKNIALCITTDGITRPSSDGGNGVPDRSGLSSSLSNVLPPCDGTGSNPQGALAQAVDLIDNRQGQNTLGTVETSLDQLSRGASTGTTSTGSLPSSLVSGISVISPATVNPGSVSSHSVHVISGDGSDGSVGNAEVHLPSLEGVLAIGSGGPTSSGLRPLSQLGLPISGLSGGTTPSTITAPISAIGVLGTVNSGSVNPQSLDIVSGGGSQGSLGSMKVESPVFGSALAIGTGGSNDHSGIPTASEGGQSGSPTHSNSPKSNSDPSGENSNGTPNGQNAPDHSGHGQPNNNAPANSPNADQNSGANGRAPPASNAGQNTPPSSPPPNRGPAPNASNSPSNGPNSAPSDGNRAPVMTNQGGNIAEFDVGIAQHFGANGLVRQRNM